MYITRVHDMRQSDADQLPNIPVEVGSEVVQELDMNPTAERPYWFYKQKESHSIPSMVHVQTGAKKPRIRKGGRPVTIELLPFSLLSWVERQGISIMRGGYITPSPDDRVAMKIEIYYNPGEHERAPLQHVSVLESYRLLHPDHTP